MMVQHGLCQAGIKGVMTSVLIRNMDGILENLEPRQVWEIFRDICAIPHGSKNEAGLRMYIEKIAVAHGYRSRIDTVGNICISIDSTPGCESAPMVVLQAHLDMVCEKNESICHDFTRDGIRYIRKGEWLMADGTTLGADNGIGVASAMAIALSEELRHGPLEILLTVEEETGLTGAKGLSPDFFTGKLFINLDSENSNAVCIGCAGGGGVTSVYYLEMERPKRGQVWQRLCITGLQGGHSGMNIHENRANALKLLARLLYEIDRHCVISVANLHGGGKHNAIPREACACIGIHKDEVQTFQRCINNLFDRFKNEYPEEKRFEITTSTIGVPTQCYSRSSLRILINLLLAYPHGVLAMSRTMPGLVETSNNLSSVDVRGERCTIHNTPRSSRPEKLDAVIEQICAITELAGGKATVEPSYPGWEPNINSYLLRLYEDTYQELFGEPPIREAIHAGLECGIIGQKKEGIDMISIGPDIRNCHSPNEAVNIPSVQRFWKVLTALLEKIGAAKAIS